MPELKSKNKETLSERFPDAMTRRRKNNTGIPEAIKREAEELSGVSLDDVRIFYKSPEPAKYGAFAFTQGKNIYIAPGQEKHIGHEVWHAVQQKQNRVKGKSYEGGLANFDKNLEMEADTFDRKWINKVVPGEIAHLARGRKSSDDAVQCLLAGSKAVPNPAAVRRTRLYFNPIMGNYAPITSFGHGVMLRADLDGIDLRHTWSSLGGHAEEALCNFLVRIEGLVANGTPPADAFANQVYTHLTQNPPPPKNLSIVLSASPCSSAGMNPTRTDGRPGCLQHLIGLHNNHGYTINIIANNWYKNVNNSADYPAGVAITVRRTAPLANPPGFDPGLFAGLQAAPGVKQFKNIRFGE